MNISGKTINLRTAEVADASFIYNLRQNVNKTQYLSKINGTVENQREWLYQYKKRENENKEFYFIIESKEGENLGLVRMYDFIDNSFCWGSWLIKEDAPKTTGIESALQIYEFAFYQRGFTQAHFEVQKDNNKVISFHKRFGAKVVNENKLEYFFTITKNDYETTKLKYKRYL